jgi:hypothetical protein
MQAIRHVLSVVVLAIVPAVTHAEPAASAPAPAAKSPPRAPTLVSVTPGDATSPVSPAFGAGANASAIVDSGRMIGQIQAAPLAQRETVIREAGSRMDAAQRALATLRDRMNSSGQRNGNAFVIQRMFMQVRTCDQAVRKNLQAARDSKTASTWATAQTALVRSYADYAKAVADVEAAGARCPVVLGP